MFRYLLAFLVCTCFQASRRLVVSLNSDVEEYEIPNFEAITKIHNHLDDDRNGEVDLTESDGFIRDELEVHDMNRQNVFHGNDTQISVLDLWKSWVTSEVHNWTSPQVVSWLVDYVQLPQYSELFSSSDVNGSVLPRLAAQQFNGVFSGIKDTKHKKKISLRAMDVILFGPPASGHNFIKDIVVAFSVLVATFGCWFAVHQKRRAKKQMDQMMKDLSVLQVAEQNFGELQERLINAEEEHQRAIQEKLDLELRLEEEMKSAKFGAEKLQDAQEGSKEHLQQLEDTQQELARVRKALLKAEKALEFQSWKAPAALKEWLQMTYVKETKHFQLKRSQALKQMADAKEACERIRKKRTSLIGSLRMAHDLTIDEVDQCILKARSSLAEVTNELQERQQRWAQIESLCGFNIVSDVNSTSAAAAPPDNGSTVAQAIANVANIGSVGSGRKLSGNSPPKEFEDPPPTYSSVAVQNTPNLNGSRALKDSLDPITVSSKMHISNAAEVKLIPKNLSQASLLNGRNSLLAAGQMNGESVHLVNGLDSSDDPLIINGNMDSFSGSKLSPPANSKSKKKYNWFSSSKRDSWNDGESGGGETEEEKRRKKIKWLWRSAALKTTARRNEQIEKGSSSIS